MDTKLDAIVLDIEGTTTSISFVKEELFPYAREHLDDFLSENWDLEECAGMVAMLRDQAAEDGVSLPPAAGRSAVSQFVRQLMDADRKVTALKRLQGAIWRAGYTAGQLTGHVYEDVPAALESWRRLGLTVWIYSSGSIAAQKLLFGHTQYGSLLQHFSGHFDTTTGVKTNADSYRKISAAIGSPAERILFVTDIPKEAEAANEAGMRTCLTIRPGNAALTDADRSRYTTVTDLSQICTV